jgi:micrococcal nuclease
VRRGDDGAATRRTVRAAMPADRLILAVAVALAGAVGAYELRGGGAAGEQAAGRGAIGRVVRVVDGDTIDVQLGATRERVRYIGVDTPETKDPASAVRCYGRQASGFNARLVAGARVRLVLDVARRDRYGRMLAYVFRVRDGLFVNAQLARRGYARPLPIAPDVRHAARFADLARRARERGRGLWSACRCPRSRLIFHKAWQPRCASRSTSSSGHSSKRPM